MKRLTIVLVSSLVASCGRECTLRGCVDTIEFVFAEAQVAHVVDGATVRVCVDDACLDHTIGTTTLCDAGLRRLQVLQGEPAAGTTAKVTLTLTREGRERLRREWPDVTFSSVEPNGPVCGPTCHAAGPLPVE